MDTYVVGSIIYRNFNTHKADGTPATLSGTPAIRVYKDDGTTEDDSGITLTVDFDSKTGLNNVKIDTSQDATFYATGHDYSVVISTGTVDSISVVGMEVWRFRLGELPVDVVKISGDSTAANNLEEYCDGTAKIPSDATLNATQGSYAPAKAGDAMTLTAAYDAAKTAAQEGDSMAVSDKTGFSLSAAGIIAIWDQLLTGILAAGSIGKLIKDNLDAAISTRSTYAGGAVASVSAGVTVTTNNDKTGYTATVSDKTGFSLSTDGILAIWHQALAGIVTASTVGKLIKDYLDAAISTRSVYAGGAVASVSSGVTLQADQAVNVTKWNGESVVAPAVSGSPVVTLGATQAAYAPAKASDIPSAATVADAVLDETLGVHTGFLTSLLTAAGYTAPPSASDVATAVWSAVARTLTDKTGFSLSQTFPTNFSSMAISALGKLTIGTNDDKTGYTATVSDKTGFSLSTDGILAIWHQLLTAITTPGSIGKLIKDNLDAKVSEVGGGTPPTVEQIRAEMDSNSAKLAHLDADVSSRLAAEDYTESPSEDDLATRITADHGAGAYGSGVGLQLKEYTLTQDGSPITGVGCWVTSDEDGLVRISPVRATNSLGKVVFQLDVPVGTTVYIWYQGAETGDPEVV